MTTHEVLTRHNNMLTLLCKLPKKILQVHGAENVTEFVLHELCDEHCFNLTRAAYFVDNPDFDCMKGVAGFSRDQAYSCKELWDKPVEFSKHMEDSQFNKLVRNMMRGSLKKNNEQPDDIAQTIAQELGFTNHAFCSWNMKYDNAGFIVFEKADEEDTLINDHAEHGFSLLGFCPVF